MDFTTINGVISSSDHVLEFGCGRMPYREKVLSLGATYTSADVFSSEKIDYRIRNDGTLENCEDVFDVILIMDVLQHVTNPEKTIQNMSNYLSENGKLIITTPFIYTECDFNDFHRWTNSGIKILLEKNGCEVISQKMRGGILFSFVYLVLSSLSNFIIGKRNGWRIKITAFKRALIFLLELAFLPIIWCSLLIDMLVIRSKTGYLGTTTVSKLRAPGNE